MSYWRLFLEDHSMIRQDGEIRCYNCGMVWDEEVTSDVLHEHYMNECDGEQPDNDNDNDN